MTLMAAPPAQKLATIWAVTSCGQGDTPWASTPWSPAKTATAAGVGRGGGQTPAMPARRTPSGSEPAEGAPGLGQAVVEDGGVDQGLGVEGADVGHRGVEQAGHARHPLTEAAQAATKLADDRRVAARVVVEVGRHEGRGGVAVGVVGEAAAEVEGVARRVDGGVVELVAPQLGAGRSEGGGDGGAGRPVAEVEAVAHGGGGGDHARHRVAVEVAAQPGQAAALGPRGQAADDPAADVVEQGPVGGQVGGVGLGEAAADEEAVDVGRQRLVPQGVEADDLGPGRRPGRRGCRCR